MWPCIFQYLAWLMQLVRSMKNLRNYYNGTYSILVVLWSLLFCISIISFFQLNPFIDYLRVKASYSLVFISLGSIFVLANMYSERAKPYIMPLAVLGLSLFSFLMSEFQSLLVIFYVALIITSSFIFDKKY